MTFGTVAATGNGACGIIGVFCVATVDATGNEFVTVFCAGGVDGVILATGAGSIFGSTMGGSAATIGCGVTAAAIGSEKAYTLVICDGVVTVVVVATVFVGPGEAAINDCDCLLARPTRFN